jgi:hypothetical protein
MLQNSLKTTMSNLSAGKIQVDSLNVAGLGAGSIKARNLNFNNLDVSGNLTVQGAQVATQAFVSSAVAGVIGSAGAALDTLGEIQAALGNDANLASTLTTSIATKAPLASPALTGVPTAPTAAAGTNTTQLATTAFVTSSPSITGPVNVTGNINVSGYLNQPFQQLNDIHHASVRLAIVSCSDMGNSTVNHMRSLSYYKPVYDGILSTVPGITNLSTTVTSFSNNLFLPTATINVVSTTGFPDVGRLLVAVSGGAAVCVNYTGKTSTSFTGCSSGQGKLITGGVVKVFTASYLCLIGDQVYGDNPEPEWLSQWKIDNASLPGVNTIGPYNYIQEFYEDTYDRARFIGDISGNVLTVSNLISGIITVGQYIVGQTAPGVLFNTQITAILDSSNQQFSVNNSQEVSSMLMDSFAENTAASKQFLDCAAYKYSFYPSAITGLSSIKSAGKLIVLWDDHDFGPNNSAGRFKYKEQAKVLAKNAFGSTGWVYPTTGGGMQSYLSVPLFNGKVLDIITLDDQYYRDSYRYMVNKGRQWDDPLNTYFGSTQKAWLENIFASTSPDYRVIMSGSPIFYERYTDDADICTDNYMNDQYFLTYLIDKYNIERTVFVSGDAHIMSYKECDFLCNNKIVSVITSGLGYASASQGPGDLNMNGGVFLVLDIEDLDNDPAFVFNTCVVDPITSQVKVMNKKTVQMKQLETKKYNLSPNINDYKIANTFDFSINNYTSNTSAFTTFPPTISLYDNTTSSNVGTFVLKGYSPTFASLKKNIRKWIVPGHSYNITVTSNNLVDSFTYSAVPNNTLNRYLFNVEPPPVSGDGMSVFYIEDFSSYNNGQVLINPDGSSAPNAPNWDGQGSADYIKLNAFLNPPPVHYIDSYAGVAVLAHLYTGYYPSMGWHPSSFSTLTKANYRKVYITFQMYAKSGALESGNGTFIYIPKAWDPINNPFVGGPGVDYVELKIDALTGSAVRARIGANGGSYKWGSQYGYFVNTGIITNTIELLFNFDNDTLTVGYNGVNVNSNIPLVGTGGTGSWNINGIGGLIFTVSQEAFFGNITTKTLAR